MFGVLRDSLLKYSIKSYFKPQSSLKPSPNKTTRLNPNPQLEERNSSSGLERQCLLLHTNSSARLSGNGLALITIANFRWSKSKAKLEIMLKGLIQSLAQLYRELYNTESNNAFTLLSCLKMKIIKLQLQCLCYLFFL